MKSHKRTTDNLFSALLHVKWTMLLVLLNCCISCGSNPHSPDADTNAGYSTPPTTTDKDSPGQTFNYNTDTTLMPENTPDSPPKPVK